MCVPEAEKQWLICHCLTNPPTRSLCLQKNERKKENERERGSVRQTNRQREREREREREFNTRSKGQRDIPQHTHIRTAWISEHHRVKANRRGHSLSLSLSSFLLPPTPTHSPHLIFSLPPSLFLSVRPIRGSLAGYNSTMYWNQHRGVDQLGE